MMARSQSRGNVADDLEVEYLFGGRKCAGRAVKNGQCIWEMEGDREGRTAKETIS
jgi:hypothetical protein